MAKNPEAAKQYDAQIRDLVSRDCARKLTSEEITNYQYRDHYNSHHVVVRPDKESTPYRLVFNPAEKFQGVSLNDFLIKGPDLLNSIIGVVLKFRENVGYLGDLSKCYHSVLVDSNVDAHTHRFLWRNLEPGRDPDVYVKQVLSFGDKPAPSMAAVAMDLDELTAEEMAGNTRKPPKSS